MARALPNGPVTFVFTDIEGSTRLQQQLGAGFTPVLERHHGLIRGLVDDHGGHVVSTEGDAFFLVFRESLAAVLACADVQRALAAEPWPAGVTVRVRIGAHTGEGVRGGDDYIGLDVNRAARVASAAHGGQVLVSGTTGALVRDRLPEGLSLRDLGEHRLKDLADVVSLAQLSVGGLAVEFPPPRTLTAASHLPAQLSSFVGRAAEVAEIRGLLGGNRLVTLTGPGGTGKTRLSLAVAELARTDFLDGAHFVPLATITDETLVVPTIAETLGLHDTAERPIAEVLREHLQGRQLLLVLDNFEQVAPAASMIGEMLADAPRVKGLVTSRGALHLQGEQEYPVPPLPVPAQSDASDPASVTGFAAVQLFVERARSVRPDFAVTDANAAAVGEICRRLDGLPLAIELAAARLRLLGPQAILERLGNRLDLLASGGRDLPERQRTLRGAIAWSHDLLEEAERALFRRLAVFVGGAAIDAVEAVCRPGPDLGLDLLEGLESLADKSLVRIDTTGDEARVAMLATIHEYALEQLAADPAAGDLRGRHAAWFRELAERREPDYVGARSADAVRCVEADDDNLRAALRWSLDGGRIDDGFLTAAALWRFWQVTGRLNEARRTFTELLAKADGATPAATFAALTGAGGIAYWQQDWAAALESYERSRGVALEIGDQRAIAEAESNIGYTLAQQGRHDEAWARTERARELMRELGDRHGMAIQEIALGFMASNRGEFDAARLHIDRSIAEFAELGDRYRRRDAMLLRAAVELRSSDDAAARRAILDAMDLTAGVVDATGEATVVDFAAIFALHAGRPLETARLAGAANAMRMRAGGGMDLNRLGLELPTDAARRELPDADLARAVAEGLAMDRRTALAAALAALGVQQE
jgi:predicted ATPase/class 3 adenylate cyclase